MICESSSISLNYISSQIPHNEHLNMRQSSRACIQTKQLRVPFPFQLFPLVVGPEIATIFTTKMATRLS